MPGLDRSGPMGVGPMTGGRMGLCGTDRSAYAQATRAGLNYGFGPGHGFRSGFGPGRGRGRGFGRGFCWYPSHYAHGYPMSEADEMEMLKADADYMQKSLDAINARIDELTKKNSP